ncbi:hypothetical protein IGI37_000147 [Enterococcus sp. AZ194]|uniref:pyrimidine/purine nucleoside phosphorylase n=1 Tax=Enterococcus sp. AZ194 TaxID=2774629 RepID=UPI003F20524F
MSKKFKNATIIEKANVYFDGKVNSRTVQTTEGKMITLGFMQPGEYTFTTDAAELMEVINGSMKIKQASSDIWEDFPSGTAFNVPKNSSFQVQVNTFADYCCSYLED